MIRRFVALVFVAALAESDPAYAGAGVSLTVGESLYVVEAEPLRGPFSLELVPSLGWDWVALDLGIYATLEELESGGPDLMFRPGIRVTPPIPVYGRAAFNLTATNGFDWGFLLGVGVDIPLIPPLGLIAELDTFLTERGEFGGRVVPLELKVGARLAF